MNSAEVLYNRFGIVAEMDSSGRVRFSNVGRCLSMLSGDTEAWQEVKRLMVDVEQNGRKYLQKDDRVIVTGARQMLVLYPGEVRDLLTRDPDLYVKALRRGKGFRRTVASERRRG